MIIIDDDVLCATIMYYSYIKWLKPAQALPAAASCSTSSWTNLD